MFKLYRFKYNFQKITGMELIKFASWVDNKMTN